MQYTTVKTKMGSIKGIKHTTYNEFRGIPYAKPPTNSLRFRAPAAIEPWEDTLNATSFKPKCPQPDLSEVPLYGKEFYDDAFYNNKSSEDCLYLNIWGPNRIEDKLYPVVIWIHGGAFDHGFSYEKEFDGKAYAERDVILVTINYRLGVFGFLNIPDRKQEDGHTGNYGLLDQISAIRFVKDNIQSFGGNPSNITLMGQSAGAMSVQALCLSPLTKGLFNKAIMQSGAGILKGLSAETSLEEGYRFYYEFLNQLKIGNITELENETAEHLLNAYLSHDSSDGDIMFSPCIDDYVLTDSIQKSIKEGKMYDIPYILGSTSKDLLYEEPSNKSRGMLFDAASDFIEVCNNNGNNQTYLYYFDHDLPGNQDGAFHSSELWYTFGTLNRCWRPMTKDDVQLSEKMLDFWTNFIKTGNPNVPTKTQDKWKKYEGSNVMLFK
ncbi:carboxylesterase family protein [Staphylococcus equorum]|uniref:carboxylesterase/lipase family protein n=1 Tax=Staphylococcus equorum TaxID=246432 RepID=UPI003980C014